jgi:hypothetical protein
VIGKIDLVICPFPDFQFRNEQKMQIKSKFYLIRRPPSNNAPRQAGGLENGFGNQGEGR